MTKLILKLKVTDDIDDRQTVVLPTKETQIRYESIIQTKYYLSINQLVLRRKLLF